MKRFITYLYECERGSKSKNVGFIRVNVRKEETVMELCIRNYLRSSCEGKVFALFYRERLEGVKLGEVKISDAQSDGRIVVPTRDVQSSGHSVDEIVGIGIRLEDGGYVASCWTDDWADEILRGEFDIAKEEHQLVIAEEEVVDEVPVDKSPQEEVCQCQKVNVDFEQENSESQNFEIGTTPNIIYEKIDLSQIRELPSPNWHLATNSFLVHGFWNYGYLVLKKEMEKDKEKFSLGVPGIFEKPEAVMAILFGFPDFQAIPQEMAEEAINHERTFSQKEKNQEASVGTFGCWFVELRK